MDERIPNCFNDPSKLERTRLCQANGAVMQFYSILYHLKKKNNESGEVEVGGGGGCLGVLYEGGVDTTDFSQRYGEYSTGRVSPEKKITGPLALPN